MRYWSPVSTPTRVCSSRCAILKITTCYRVCDVSLMTVLNYLWSVQHCSKVPNLKAQPHVFVASHPNTSRAAWDSEISRTPSVDRAEPRYCITRNMSESKWFITVSWFSVRLLAWDDKYCKPNSTLFVTANCQPQLQKLRWFYHRFQAHRAAQGGQVSRSKASLHGCPLESCATRSPESSWTS